MKTNQISNVGTNIYVIVLGVLAALLILAVLTGRKLPFLASERAALVTVVVLGMLICSRAGIGQIAAQGAWWHPLSIAGYLLGAAILAIGIAALFGRNIPPMASYYQSFVAVTAIAAIKLVLTTIHRLFW